MGGLVHLVYLATPTLASCDKHVNF